MRKECVYFEPVGPTCVLIAVVFFQKRFNARDNREISFLCHVNLHFLNYKHGTVRMVYNPLIDGIHQV